MDASPASKPAPNGPADEAVVIAAIELARTAASPSDPLSRTPVADPQSREVMFRALDQGPQQLARAQREEALRRRRAYDRTMARGERTREFRRRTDLRA